MNRLLTIPISHYCDKARWALEVAGIPYVEEAHVQGFSWWAADRAQRGARSLPILITPDEVFTDSADIVAWAGAGLLGDDAEAREQILAWQRRFDDELGPASRLWVYHRTFPHPALLHRYGLAGVPTWQRALFPVFRPFMQRKLISFLDISPQRAAEALATVDRVATEVEAAIEGREYLVGNRFTAADLTFAALYAPMIMPREYGVPLPPPEEYDPETREIIEQHRARPGGQFALRLYQSHRTPPSPRAPR